MAITITNGYATLKEFKEYADGSGALFKANAADDRVIATLIESASRWIDEELHTTFYARSETRSYDVPIGKDRRALVLDDDLLSITTLTNGDGTTIAASEYDLLPINGDYYHTIQLKTSSSVFWEYDSNGNREGVIDVNGDWGRMSTHDKRVNQLCLELTLSAYKRRYGEGIEGVAKTTGYGLVITPRDLTKYGERLLAQLQPIGIF